MLVIPVILPPGRFKLATIPSATGSLSAANTMEISVAELVACTTFAARMAEVPNGTITLTRKLSRSFVLNLEAGRKRHQPNDTRF